MSPRKRDEAIRVKSRKAGAWDAFRPTLESLSAVASAVYPGKTIRTWVDRFPGGGLVVGVLIYDATGIAAERTFSEADGDLERCIKSVADRLGGAK